MPASLEQNDERSFFGGGAREGDVIADRYRVVRELGAGGMGQVVEVEHLELEKRFALKLIRPDRWDATLEARFRREAKALARVDSPRVAQVTDFGVEPLLGPFYVMELVQGRPLHQVIRDEGPLDREHALELAIGIAEALADVHDAGLVHRDIKPANIGVCERGPVPVRLLDFGLATSMDDQLGSRITESRRVIGSFPYMAPEQFQGEDPSPRIDVWALGVVLYEMLCSELPFEAPSTAALIHQILAVDVPMRHAAPRRCSRVLGKLLAKAPSDRPADAGEVLVLLEEALIEPATDERFVSGGVATAEATVIDTDAAVTTATPPPAPRAWMGVTLALVGLGGLFGAWLVMQPDDAQPSPAEDAALEGDAPTELATSEAPPLAHDLADAVADQAEDSTAQDTTAQDTAAQDTTALDTTAQDTEEEDGPPAERGDRPAARRRRAARATPASAPPDEARTDLGAADDTAEAATAEADETATEDAPPPAQEEAPPAAEPEPAWTGDIIEAPSP